MKRRTREKGEGRLRSGDLLASAVKRKRRVEIVGVVKIDVLGARCGLCQILGWRLNETFSRNERNLGRREERVMPRFGDTVTTVQRLAKRVVNSKVFDGVVEFDESFVVIGTAPGGVPVDAVANPLRERLIVGIATMSSTGMYVDEGDLWKGMPINRNSQSEERCEDARSLSPSQHACPCAPGDVKSRLSCRQTLIRGSRERGATRGGEGEGLRGHCNRWQNALEISLSRSRGDECESLRRD